MKNYEDKIYSLVLLCICTTLYNETLRCCFAIGEKNIKKLMINGELVIEWIKEKNQVILLYRNCGRSALFFIYSDDIVLSFHCNM